MDKVGKKFRDKTTAAGQNSQRKKFLNFSKKKPFFAKNLNPEL
jgi:hypothetical protein